MRNDLDRLTGWAALATAALAMPGMVAGMVFGVAAVGTEPAALAVQLAAHRTTTLGCLVLGGLGWGGTLIVFVAGLGALLRAAEGGHGVWSTTVVAAGVATAAGILVCEALLATLVHQARVLPPPSLPLLYAAAHVANLMTAFPNAVYTIAAGLVIVRTGVLPRWVAHGAFIVAAIHLLSATAFAARGLFAPSGLFPSLAPLSHTAWLLAVAWVLLRPAPAAARPRPVTTG